MLYEQNNAPWEIIDLGVSLDIKHLHPHEKTYFTKEKVEGAGKKKLFAIGSP